MNEERQNWSRARAPFPGDHHPNKKQICNFYLTPRGCSFGNRCKYSHEQGDGPPTQVLEPGTTILPCHHLLGRRPERPSSITLTQPKHMFSFGLVSSTKEYVANAQLGKYVSTEPRLPIDLAVGFDAAETQRDDEDSSTRLTPILRCLSENNVRLDLIAASFLSFRGNITRMLNTVNSPRDVWRLGCARYQSVVFIDMRLMEQSATFASRRGAYCGRKFENMFIQSPPAQLDDGTVKSYEYCTLLTTRLGSHKLLLGAEVDGMDEKGCMVELKTSQRPKNMETFGKFKYSKWWAQSYLAGIPKIICGWMNEGTLEEIQIHETLHMHK
eukprot:c18323_g1_i1.p1 GENE.c18323_g1_i1~~c18323_g1_i1.p1  ORF type:complete len:327 (-),score=42.47 c18323_g1_i1:294-1274(-)